MKSEPRYSLPKAGPIGQGVRAGLVAGVTSGAPSTLYCLATRRDPLEATVAAGSMLLRNEGRRMRLVAAAIPVHFTLSVFWGVVLAAALPRRPSLFAGTVAGLAIGTIDLVLIGRRFPRIRALPRAPQFADHVAFGITVAKLLHESRE